jgi:hypothetical protein
MNYLKIILCISYFSLNAFANSTLGDTTQPAKTQLLDNGPSVARLWNQLTLSAIRKDYARPTIAARNLYHMSILAYDAWAMYDKNVKNFFYTQKHEAENVEQARLETLTVASYKLILHRFKTAPQFQKILAEANALAEQLNVDVTHAENRQDPIGWGNDLAQMIINMGNNDGSLEDKDYETPPNEFIPLNSPLIVKQSGVGPLKNVNYWQPLALDFIIDQGGNPLASKIQFPLTLHWGNVRPFALEANDRNPKTNVYFDPGAPPMWNGLGHEDFINSMVQVIRYSSWLDPKDNAVIDISPNEIGNNSLGRNDGKGYLVNPITQKPYQVQKVSRGDYARVLAEFWSDGPNSETPPGHWNVVANNVCDHPLFQRRWMGQVDVNSKLEWDVKMYLTLNGALHDTAIAVWGVKGYYQGSRPITAIRYLAGLGQSNHPELPSYNVLGLPLVDGLIELVTLANTAPGEKLAHLVGQEGKLAVLSWKGAPASGLVNKGVGWILAEDWLPYQKPTFVTPPFPGYVSGHSGYSRAAAEVLAAITGSAYFPGGLAEYKFKAQAGLSFEVGPSEDVTLQWATYYDAADQSALSRIFGGIHGNIDDFPSRKIGYRIGRKAVAKSQKLFN